MTLNDYKKQALKTAIYEDKILYPALGLAGESGELVEKIKKLIVRNGVDILDPKFREPILLEISDTLWYLFLLYHDMKVKIPMAYTLMDAANRGVYFSTRYIKPSIRYSPFNLIIKLNKVAAHIADYALDYNDNPIFTISKDFERDFFVFLHVAQRLAEKFYVDIQDIAYMNIKKLEKRHKEGKIYGEGDNR